MVWCVEVFVVLVVCGSLCFVRFGFCYFLGFMVRVVLVFYYCL